MRRRLFTVHFCRSPEFTSLRELIALAISSTVHAQVSGEIIQDLGNESSDTAVSNLATTMAASGNGLALRSGQLETQTFVTAFTARQDTTKLVAFSDDGLDVWIKEIAADTDIASVTFADDDRVLNRFKRGQHLPDLSQSLVPIPATFGAGKRYGMKIAYSNINFTGGNDVDGFKIFAYKGGVGVDSRIISVRPSPALIPVGTDVTFTAVGTGLSGVAWSAQGGPTNQMGMGSTFTTRWNTSGSYVVTATLNAQVVSVMVTVVKVDKIVVAGTTDDGGPRSIPKNSSLGLKAIPSPGSKFPSGTPQWTIQLPAGVQPGQNSPLRDYPKTAASINFTSDIAGTFVLTATCGTSTQTFTVYVLDTSLWANDDEYFLNGSARNDMLTDTSPLKAMGKVSGQPAGATLTSIAANDGATPIPDSVTFELRSAPLFAASFTLDSATGAFTYQPKDTADQPWLTQTIAWQHDNPDATIQLSGRAAVDRFHGDYFIYRLTTTVNGTSVSTSDALVSIYPPRTYTIGSGTDSNAIGKGGLALVGGSDAGFNELFAWIVNRANGGDIVILKAAGDSAYYSDEFSGLMPTPNSVTTLVLDGTTARNADLATKVANAEAILIGGGDQDQYIAQWRGTAVGNALEAKAATWSNATGCAIAGSSAGMHILGKVDYSGVRGGAVSIEVLPNPRHPTISELAETPLQAGETITWAGVNVFDDSFLKIQDGIMDTHFEARDRMGRWLIMMGRTGATGIAVGEATAYVQEPGGASRVLEGSAKSVFMSSGTNAAAWMLGPFNGTAAMSKLTNGAATQSYQVTATQGVLSSSAEGGLIYGVD